MPKYVGFPHPSLSQKFTEKVVDSRNYVINLFQGCDSHIVGVTPALYLAAGQPQVFLSPPTTMTLKALSSLIPLALLLFTNVNGACVHTDGTPAKVVKLPLKKMTTISEGLSLADKSYEVAALARKYGGTVQKSFLPDDGYKWYGDDYGYVAGKDEKDGEQLFWTQEMKNQGGHNIPLESESVEQRAWTTLMMSRLYECSVLYGNWYWNS